MKTTGYGHAHVYDNAGRGSKPNPRNRNGHARRKLRNRVRSLGLPCAICGRPIDYSLPPGHPMSYELDEICPVALGGDPLDMRNVQPSHRICNERKGASFGASKKGEKPAAMASKDAKPATMRRSLPLSREW